MPLLDEIFGIILKDHLASYLEKCNILSESQIGFRESRSTIIAMIQLIGDIVNEFDQETSTIAYMCDFSKAFNCICVEELSYKIEH